MKHSNFSSFKLQLSECKAPPRFFGVLTQGSPQLHTEAPVDSGHNPKPKAMLSFLPRVSARPVTPCMTMPGPTAFKKRQTRVSSKACFLQLDPGDHQVPELVIQASSCAVSPAQYHNTGRPQEGCVQEPFSRGLSALRHQASSPTGAGDRAETHRGRAGHLTTVTKQRGRGGCAWKIR